MKIAIMVSAAALALSSISITAFAADAQQLLKDKACLSCHSLDKKLVGPSYKDIAAKYKARKDGEDYLAKRIREGSTGVWGQIPMPANSTVSADDAKVLAKYILTVK